MLALFTALYRDVQSTKHKIRENHSSCAGIQTSNRPDRTLHITPSTQTLHLLMCVCVYLMIAWSLFYTVVEVFLDTCAMEERTASLLGIFLYLLVQLLT